MSVVRNWRSLRRQFDDASREVLGRCGGRAAPLVSERDLLALPGPLATYCRRAGVVGRPRVRALHARFRGQMRTRPTAPWMSATIEQIEAFCPNVRLFFMRAWRTGVPFSVYHAYRGTAATMRVRVAGIFPVVDAGGPVLTRSETVTLFNDLCVLAPAALLDADVTWDPIDTSRVEGEFRNAGHAVRAVLEFDASGDLVNFRSDDRAQSDGTHEQVLPWLTPLSGFRDFGGVRLPAIGEARWLESGHEWAYARFELRDIAYNVAAP